MGVDHGLGGKNSEKSRLRRAKKAKKIAAIAKSVLTKKKEIVFDEESRVKYLTGFRKRKQERREYGHAMQLLHDKKVKLEKRKQMRTAIKTMLDPVSQGDDANNVEELAKDNGLSGIATFEDPQTKALFGAAVSVVVDSGIAEEMDRNFQENINEIRKPLPPKNAPKEPTKLERALVKAKQKLNSMKKKKSLKKSEGTKLYHKALGSGALGSHTFSKKDKGRRGKKK